MALAMRWLPAAALLLAACATTSVQTAQVDREAVGRYRAAGYAIPAAATIEADRISGPASEAPWTISLTRPADTANCPLIIYLPGLGEADNTPNQWIGTWARAGYAVIAIQPLPDDAEVWATPEARSGDFERIARARFADDLMADRLARLSTLLKQIRERSLRGETGLQRLDWSRLAIAGADLGAFTVQSIATSTAASRAAISWPLTPLAYVAISPYAVHNGAASPAEAPLHAPVLMISARDDVDAYGVITDASLRRLAFDRLGPGDDYYLELASATHRWLAGVVRAPEGGEQRGTRRAAFRPDDPAARRAPGSARDSMAPGGEEDDSSPDKAAKNTARLAQIEKERSRVLTNAALSEVSFAAVSIAFLDANVRQQAGARSWLSDAAPKWLQDGDRLKHR